VPPCRTLTRLLPHQPLGRCRRLLPLCEPHVTLGIIWLLGLFFAARKGRLGPATSLDVEIMGLYWHFVDIVWIVIFTLLYLIGGFDTGPSVPPGG